MRITQQHGPDRWQASPASDAEIGELQGSAVVIPGTHPDFDKSADSPALVGIMVLGVAAGGVGAVGALLAGGGWLGALAAYSGVGSLGVIAAGMYTARKSIAQRQRPRGYNVHADGAAGNT